MTEISPRLLVSVRDVAEARLALNCGVDLIDIKEPRLGSLGAASTETIRTIAQEIHGGAKLTERRPLSVALGELLREATDSSRALAATRQTASFQFAKVGLAGCATRPDWPATWSRCFDFLPANVRRVAVVYADHQPAGSPTFDEVLRETIPRSASAVLVDTFDKRGPGLLRLWSPAEIIRVVATAREQGLTVVLAGQLSLDDIPSIAAYRPDFVAVRGAACLPDRNGRLDAGQLAEIVSMLGVQNI